jgi:hypothetical protein
MTAEATLAEVVQKSRLADISRILAKRKEGQRITGAERAELARFVKQQCGPASAADRMSKMRSQRADIAIKEYVMSERRKACMNHPLQFMATYLSHWFPLPHSQDQMDDIEDMRRLYMEARDFANARPRGWGKTTDALAVAIWASLNGHCLFNPVIAAVEMMAKNLHEMIVSELASNELLKEDWPDICLPIEKAWGKWNSAKYITVNGKPAELKVSVTKLVFPSVRCCTDGPNIYGAVFVCAGLGKASRGISHRMADGKIVRPQVALLDDFQTDRSANSVNQCVTRMRMIRNTIKRMGGPNKKVHLGILCTVIKKGDVADQILDRKKNPDFHGVRRKMVYEFPKKMGDGRSQTEDRGPETGDGRPGTGDGRQPTADKSLTPMQMWEVYMAKRKQGMRDGDKGKAANEYFAANREAMLEGSVVGWAHGFDPSMGETCTLQSFFNIVADDGEESAWAEMQNEPIVREAAQVRLTAETVLYRVNGLKPGEVPAGAQCVTAHLDPNDHAIAFVAMAGRREGATGVLSGNVVAYGEWGMNGLGEIGATDRSDRIWDEDHPHPEGKEQRFWKALDGLTAFLFTPGMFWKQRAVASRAGEEVGEDQSGARIAVALDLVLIDARYTLQKGSKLVVNWCYAFYMRKGTNVMPSYGWAASGFRFNRQRDVRFSEENWWRVTQDEQLPVRLLHHDADWHRRQMQNAWLLAPGSPGSMTVYGETQNAAVEHLRFGQQIAGEKLAQYNEPNRPGFSGQYTWERTPSIRNEMGDCCTGARLAALYFLGAGGGGAGLGNHHGEHGGTETGGGGGTGTGAAPPPGGRANGRMLNV